MTKMTMNNYISKIKKWYCLCDRIKCQKNAGPVLSRLIDAYRETHRVYHDLNHIIQCLKEFDQVKGDLKNADHVEMAIWFHDAVYRTSSNKNEEKSAEWAVRELINMGANTNVSTGVYDLILATRHDKYVDDTDSRYLIDIDLSILGASPDRYREYEENIRIEYKWVPHILFKRKRKEILKAFLEKENVYYTKYFREKYEQQARLNMITVLETE